MKGVDSAYISKGAAFIVIFERIFLHRSTFKNETVSAIEVFPFLANTCLQDLSISNLIVKNMSKKVMKKSSKTIFIESFSIEVCVLVKPIQASSTADLMLLFSYENNIKDSPRPILGFQFKNLIDDVSISMVNEEIKKFKTAVMASRSHAPLNADCKALFVIVMTGKGTKEVEKLRGEVFDNRSSIKGLNIPNHMQLLILLDSDVSKFINEVNLENLRNLNTI